MSKGKFITTRGDLSDTRPISDIPLKERLDILIECQEEESRIVRERHQISNRTLSHIRFYHGNSSAKKRGYYFKPLLSHVETPEKKVRELKSQGKTSREVSELLKMSLSAVNKLWA